MQELAGNTRGSEVGTPSGDPDASAAWQELRELYPSRVSQSLESLYALPEVLIEIITAKCPGFLSEDDLRFERDLVRLGGCGFFRGRPFRYSPLAPESSENAQTELDFQVEESNARIQELLDREMIEHGTPATMIQLDREAMANEKAIAIDLQWGYAGWLATNRVFRQGCQALRDRIDPATGWGQPLPSMGHTVTGYSNHEYGEEYHRLWQPFYTSWSLERIVTWELPVPLRAELNAPCLYDYARLNHAGVKLFIPWYLSRYRGLDLNELLERQQRIMMPHALSEWFSSRDGSWGPERYLTILRLYAYLHLAIGTRYADSIRGKRAVFDRVFAEYFGRLEGVDVNEDTVRKLRLHLQKRLND